MTKRGLPVFHCPWQRLTRRLFSIVAESKHARFDFFAWWVSILHVVTGIIIIGTFFFFQMKMAWYKNMENATIRCVPRDRKFYFHDAVTTLRLWVYWHKKRLLSTKDDIFCCDVNHNIGLEHTSWQNAKSLTQRYSDAIISASAKPIQMNIVYILFTSLFTLLILNRFLIWVINH